MQSTAEVLKEWEDAKGELAELEALVADPDTDQELRELAIEDVESTTVRYDKLSQTLTTSLTPKHPFASLGCLLEIRPGVGGGEAAIFAIDLLKMYQAYCLRKGMRATLIKYEETDGGSGAIGEAQLAEAIIEIETPGAYGDLRSEAGVHRVQRVPATEKQGRTHTSAAQVLVLPNLPTTGNSEETMTEADLNDPDSDYYVNSTDVRTDVMRSRGAGGQHVNTTDSAIRLTHIPTNTVVSMQDSRSQHKNREKAWTVLRSRLAQMRREAREEEMLKLRRSVTGIGKTGRGDKVRTYNYGQQRVSDHRSGLTLNNLDDVMAGGHALETIIESVKTWLSERDLEILIMQEEDNCSKEKKT